MTEDAVKSILSGNIRHLRLMKDLSQQELAEKTNISVPFLSALERGEKFPSAESLGKLSEALEVSLSELFKADSVESLNTDYKSLIKDYFESQKETLTRLCEKL